MNRSGAGDAAQPAAFCAAQAQQADDIALIVVEGQAASCVEAAHGGILVLIATGVAHIDEQFGALRLGQRDTEMSPDSPIDEPRPLQAVFFNRNSTHQHHASAVLHLAAKRKQRGRKVAERELFFLEGDREALADARVAAPDPVQRCHRR